ncbi:family 16 glycosylhydrolase [Thalassotalea ganghwensis]
MKKPVLHKSTIVACLSASLLIGCGGGVETNTNTSNIDPTAPVTDWQLVWSDEFDGTSIDSTKWNHEVNCAGGGNNEQQCYTDSSDNSFIADGLLHIVAMPAEEGADKPYTSARLTTKYKGDFKYGRFEMRAKLPSGQGSWPAFWMMPTDEVYGGWPKSGEIDIMEAVNLKTLDEDGKAENRVHGTLHYGRAGLYSGQEYSLPEGMNPADDFHTYAIEWQEGEIRWYVDNYLYATQRQSEVRYNSKKQAVGLAHQGWFAEYYDQTTGELTTHWDSAPFDQDFYMILNLAVGGNWPESANNTGVDPSVFENGQHFEIDYVRVYECIQDIETGKGCETVRAGYDLEGDGLVLGKAPIPSPPSAGGEASVDIFSGTPNPNWPAWDCCGGSTPTLVEDDQLGNVYEFVVGATATVNGFITRAAEITDPEGKPSPFDASAVLATGTVSFDLKVVSPPNNTDSVWKFKIESDQGATALELNLSDSVEGQAPIVGEWQTFTFNLSDLAEAGLDVSAIDVVMIFPAWSTGEGAVYRVTNVKIGADVSLPKLVVFEDEENPSWPMWDCCGGSTPLVQVDDDEHGAVAEFSIGAEPTVMGFISRAENITDPSAQPMPFDASAILADGVVQFDLKVITPPSNPDSVWKFKIESNQGETALELSLTESVEALSPATEQWQTFTFNLSDLADKGLDVSAIDVLMIFPAWGTGEGALYRVDNVKIFDPTASDGFIGHVLFDDQPLDQWTIWDCCGGSTPTIENDDADHGLTAEFVIGSTATVMGLKADDGVYLDASNLLNSGVVQFEMKVISAPNDANAAWKFKIESSDATGAVELDLTASQEGVTPVVGQWQTYTYSLIELYDAGVDISAIDVIMVFPQWGAGEGAVYRLDNVMIYDPSSLPAQLGLTLYDDAQNPEWPIWDCCAGSTPTEEDDDTEHGKVAEFVIGDTATVMGFKAEDGVTFDASNLFDNGAVKFDLKVVTPPSDSSSVWKFKIESNKAETALELNLTDSVEGVAPTTGEWQTYTFMLDDLFAAGLDISAIDVVMVFPAWGTGSGAVYRIDNAAITVP